eukprot:2338040-Alexandrium_andersonii.AAC.1
MISLATSAKLRPPLFARVGPVQCKQKADRAGAPYATMATTHSCRGSGPFRWCKHSRIGPDFLNTRCQPHK